LEEPEGQHEQTIDFIYKGTRYGITGMAGKTIAYG